MSFLDILEPDIVVIPHIWVGTRCHDTDVTFSESNPYFSRSSSSGSEIVSSNDFLTYTLIRTPRPAAGVDSEAPSHSPITHVYARRPYFSPRANSSSNRFTLDTGFPVIRSVT